MVKKRYYGNESLGFSLRSYQSESVWEPIKVYDIHIKVCKITHSVVLNETASIRTMLIFLWEYCKGVQ